MPPSPDPVAAYSRALTHSDRLFEALEDLASSGGLRGLRSRIKPASVGRAAELLRSVRAAIDDELKGLDRPDPKPAHRVLCRRQANRPNPIPTVR